MQTDVGCIHSRVCRDAKPQITQSVNLNNDHYATNALTQEVTYIVPGPTPWTLHNAHAGAQRIVAPQGARVLKIQ